eukprot:8000611-Pyramimonas_sp.AAC.1
MDAARSPRLDGCPCPSKPGEADSQCNLAHMLRTLIGDDTFPFHPVDWSNTTGNVAPTRPDVAGLHVIVSVRIITGEHVQVSVFAVVDCRFTK